MAIDQTVSAPNIDEQIRRVKATLVDLIPETGQSPFILFHQARRALNRYNVGWMELWGMMGAALYQLHQEGKVYPQQTLGQTILKTAYKS